MTSPKKKQEIVTFKADEPLLEAMNGIPNRSEFIRAAILSALDSVCPLCKGSGILTPDQRRHWVEFTAAPRPGGVRGLPRHALGVRGRRGSTSMREN